MSGEIVYAFPDDMGTSLERVLSFCGLRCVSLPLGESLLSVSLPHGPITFRLAFGHIKRLTDDIFSVPDPDYADCRDWLVENAHHIGGAWRDLEVLSFDSPSDQVRFESAYASVLGHPAEALDPAFWPHVFRP